ncbi:MAG: hypothetical protein CBB80_011520 [Synechococcus sp. TMED20]|nr:MAG: hypothetical protein CBB80_011520 [Synechococcus sp. TMED20]
MALSSGFRRALLASGVAVLSALTSIAPGRAGFSPEQLAGFEVTHVRGTVTTVLPEQKVLEIVDPEGHKEIITVGIDMAPLGIQVGDGVDVSVLDGLVVDLTLSGSRELSFDREDIIMPTDMGPLKKGMRVALASGTARVIKVSSEDRSISLMGPLGGIHNLDVVVDASDDLFPRLTIGDVVDFRLIQPVAVGLDRIAVADGIPGTTDAQPLVARIVNSDATLKAELLQAFEITKVKGKVMRLSPADRVLEIQSPYGHSMLITSGVDLSSSGLAVGDTVTIDLLDGLVVDLRRSPVKRLSFRREDMILSEDFGPVRQGARVAMATGTAEVVKVSAKDHEVSLRGPFGGVHNLDVREGIKGDPAKTLNVGDYVEFRMIKPIAIAIRKGE